MIPLYFIKLARSSSQSFALLADNGPVFKNLFSKAFCELVKTSQNLLTGVWGSFMVGLLWLAGCCFASSTDPLRMVFYFVLVAISSFSSTFFLLFVTSATGFVTFTTSRGSFSFPVFDREKFLVIHRIRNCFVINSGSRTL